MSEQTQVTIYTDGGADPNPGPGGWGVVLIHEATGTVKELSGSALETTNNRMELTAAISALEALKKPCQVTLYTDSLYLKKGITEWLPKWIAKGWKRGRGKEIENLDLWQRLAKTIEPHSIDWQWIKGHAGNAYNERADRLATTEIKKLYRQQSDDFDNRQADEADAVVYLLVSAKGSAGWWGALVRADGEEELMYGHETQTTSNRLDILALINALTMLPEGARVKVYSKSDYLRNGGTHWLKSWKRSGWISKQGEPVKNQDLWLELDDLLLSQHVEFPPVDEDNEYEFGILAERLQDAVSFEADGQNADSEFYD